MEVLADEARDLTIQCIGECSPYVVCAGNITLGKGTISGNSHSRSMLGAYLAIYREQGDAYRSHRPRLHLHP